MRTMKTLTKSRPISGVKPGSKGTTMPANSGKRGTKYCGGKMK